MSRLARPSAEHLRAVDAAIKLELRLFKKVAQRPLMSVWEGEDKSGQRVLLTVVDAPGTPAERARIVSAARALTPLVTTPGVQHIHRLVDEGDAFVSDYFGAGTAADLVVLRWSSLARLDFACRVAEGLVAIHAAGLVHGCLCPDNILLDDDLRPVLTEVGMVSVAESLGGDPESFFGYGAYASAEARHGTPDVASDIYGFGRLLSSILLDRTPEDDESLAGFDAISAEVTASVRRAVGPVASRQASMHEMLVELQQSRKKLQPATAEVKPRIAAPAMAPRPAPKRETVSPAAVWANAEAAITNAAPWWVALASAIALGACLVAAQLVIIRSELLHIVLETVVAGAAIGLTAVIRATTGVRILMTMAALGIALGADPVTRLSRLESGDSATRRSAARRFVLSGGKDLHAKRFQTADLSGLDLVGADLSAADLTRTDFAHTNLMNAEVDGTCFIRANLAGADLTGVALERSYGVETALCDATTVFPSGWYCSPSGNPKHRELLP